MVRALRVLTAAVSAGVLGLLAGCDRPVGAASPWFASAPPGDLPAPPVQEAWVGQWDGPDGTFLRIAGGGGYHAMTFMARDGAASYTGRSEGDTIVFRRGKGAAEETLRATTGRDTGVASLAGKKTCLTVTAGEGYCRD